MKASWTTGLDAVKKDDVTAEYQGSATLRKRLVQMLEKKQKTAYDKTLNADNYDSPNWGFLQADAVGYQRALREIIDLLD